MSDIQAPNAFETNETLDGAVDIMEVYQPGSGGIRRNKKAFLDTLKTFFHNNIIKTLNSIVLTNYISTGVPAIAANSVCEINGDLYTNPSEVAITGTTADNTWYDILLTPAGTTFTASYIARGTGVWSDSKQGLYSGNNRVVACVFRISATVFINKNILMINNRNVIIEIEIGDWDMDATATLTVAHGLTLSKIRSVSVTIISDGGTIHNHLDHGKDSAGQPQGFVDWRATDINLGRVAGGTYDDTAYDETSFNRGWIVIKYLA